MKKLLATSMFLFVLTYFVQAQAQSKTITISGKITSFEESLPLEGVSVQVKNSNNSTGTQADGIFNIALAAEEKILVISLPGYEKQEITITNAREYNIVLKRAGNVALANRRQSMYIGQTK